VCDRRTDGQTDTRAMHTAYAFHMRSEQKRHKDNIHIGRTEKNPQNETKVLQSAQQNIRDVFDSGPLAPHKNKASSTKPEVHNVLHYRGSSHSHIDLQNSW